MPDDITELLSRATPDEVEPLDYHRHAARGRRRRTVKRGAAGVSAVAAATAAIALAPGLALPDAPTIDPAAPSSQPSPTQAEEPMPDAGPLPWVPEFDDQRADVAARLSAAADDAERQRLQATLDALDALTRRGPRDVLAPVDHADAAYQSLVTTAMTRRADAVIAQCLTRAGHEPLPSGPYIERERDLVGVLLSPRVQYPDLDLMSAVGLPLDERAPDTLTRPIGPTDEHLAAIETCQQTEERRIVREERDRVMEIVGLWWAHTNDVLQSDDGADEFTTCMVDAGVPPSAAQRPRTFLSYAAQLQMDAADNADPALNDLVAEHGQLYAACGRPLFSARTDKRQELRDDFVADHRAELEELTDLLARALGIGLDGA